MAASNPPKSILKKTQAPLPESSNLPVPKSDQEKKRLAVALEHARLLQDQKDTMRDILNSIEYLAETPAASTPTQAEIDQFTSLLMPFQPSDYDALIEERHAMNRCGYALCPNPPRKTDLKRPWLRAKGSKHWCSDDCARRALYVKAQLDEVPAWERRGGAAAAIVLYGQRTSSSAPSENPTSTDDRKRAEQRELALERGEGKVASFKIDGVTTTEILEKTPSTTATPPVLAAGETQLHDLIDGYQPRDRSKKVSIQSRNPDDDDDDDGDWKF